jgi:asparagine synthase (glutamine-hydrolysing)
MCGIAGFLDPDGRGDGHTLTGIARRMAAALRHRGPDDAGEWVSPADGLALGFRRLSVIDLSAAGAQPMLSPRGRYALVFNGEIYNHAELWERLEKESGGARPPRRGHSDTEVLLAAIEEWGLEAALGRSVGMFALAVWDRRDRVLRLARDRVGEKPLYYGWAGGAFVFGSELKALRAAPGFDRTLNRDVLADYVREGYVAAPRTIYRSALKLPAGTTLRVAHPAARPEPEAYWDHRREAEAAAADPFRGDERAAVDELERRLGRAVAGQMRADVPLGALLSGGVDSSLLVALMQARSARPVRTFTVGFAEAAFDEAPHARRVARHLGTDHTELYVGPAEVVAEVPALAAVYDEPFADASALPTLLICREARRSVTVALSGDGGDELFAGYNWYAGSERIWRSVRWMPRPLRQAAASALRGLSVGGWDRVLRSVGRGGGRLSGDRIHKFADLIGRADSAIDVYRGLSDRAPTAGHLVLDAAGGPALRRPGGPGRDAVRQAMDRDQVRYLPDNCLVKVERASMSVGLELRAPILDHRVLDLSWRLPVDRTRGHKWALRGVLARYVPPALVDRPKQGFCVPIDSWLRGPLRAWAEDLLSEDRLRRDGIFDPAAVRRRLEEHLVGGRNWQYGLWHTLMFQSWLAAERSPPPGPGEATPPPVGVIRHGLNGAAANGGAAVGVARTPTAAPRAGRD